METLFKSKRVRDVPPPDAPPPFLTGMGWGPAEDPGTLPLEPAAEAAAQRAAGVAALADLGQRNAERDREAIEARLDQVRRLDYSRSLR